MTTIPAPAYIGPYQVFFPLGAGGMGEVFLARSPGSRLVALKVVRAEYAGDHDFRLRFRREVDAARRVSGLFTPPVLDADPDAPRPWLATAYVPAPALGEVVRGFGVLTEPAQRALGAGLAEALSAIHAAGLVHRDLKPGNVLLAADGPRVIDFGISKAVDATQLTHTGGTLGTPGYLAPEQIASGADIGPAADVFAFGCVLVFAATGANPFGTGQPSDLYYRVVYAEPNLAGTPESLRPLLAACLAKQPGQRPTVAALLDALTPADPADLLTPALRHDLDQRARFAATVLNQPTAPAQPTTPPKPSRRRFLGVAAAGGVVAVAGATGAAVWLSGSGKPAGAQPAPPGPSTSSAPAAPAPNWTRTAPAPFTAGRLALLGGTIVWYGGQTALGFDARTGNPLWTKQVPVGGNQGDWLGAADGVLYGSATDNDTNVLFGIDATGQQVIDISLGPESETVDGYLKSTSVFLFYGAGNGTALIGTSGDSYAVVAVDLTARSVRWSYPVSTGTFAAAADARHCYLQDGNDTVAVDLVTGRPVWRMPGTVQSGVHPLVSLAGSAVLLTGIKLVALDPADGRQLWTAVNESTGLIGPAANANRIFVGDGQNIAYAVDPATGQTLWQRALPVELAPSGAELIGTPPVASSSVLVMPLLEPKAGMVVVKAADGTLLWVREGDGVGNGSTAQLQWAVLAGPDLVYGASGTTLYAFPAGAA